MMLIYSVLFTIQVLFLECVFRAHCFCSTLILILMRSVSFDSVSLWCDRYFQRYSTTIRVDADTDADADTFHFYYFGSYNDRLIQVCYWSYDNSRIDPVPFIELGRLCCCFCYFIDPSTLIYFFSMSINRTQVDLIKFKFHHIIMIIKPSYGWRYY